MVLRMLPAGLSRMLRLGVGIGDHHRRGSAGQAAGAGHRLLPTRSRGRGGEFAAALLAAALIASALLVTEIDRHLDGRRRCLPAATVEGKEILEDPRFGILRHGEGRHQPTRASTVTVLPPGGDEERPCCSCRHRFEYWRPAPGAQSIPQGFGARHRVGHWRRRREGAGNRLRLVGDKTGGRRRGRLDARHEELLGDAADHGRGDCAPARHRRLAAAGLGHETGSELHPAAADDVDLRALRDGGEDVAGRASPPNGGRDRQIEIHHRRRTGDQTASADGGADRLCRRHGSGKARKPSAASRSKARSAAGWRRDRPRPEGEVRLYAGQDAHEQGTAPTP